MAGHVDELAGIKIERAQAGDGCADILAVGADVLDGRAADEAGDPGEALDAVDALLADCADEEVPVESGADFEIEVVVGRDDAGLAAEIDLEDQAWEAGIGYDEVGAAAEDEEGKLVFVREAGGCEEVAFAFDLHEVAGGARRFSASCTGLGGRFPG